MGPPAVIELLLPPDMGVASAVALLATSFAASFITIAFGIGGGATLLAVMASLAPPAALIPVHGVIQAGSNLGRAVITRGHVHWSAVPAFVVGSAIGAGLGGLVVVRIPPSLVQVGVGLFVIWSIFAKPPQAIRRWPFAIGAISSFLTMFFGATGVFVASFTRSLALGRHAHVATHAVLMTVQHGVKTATFGLLGFAFGPWIGFIAAMILAGLAGTAAGGLVLNRLGDARFRRGLEVVLVLISARLVIGGLMELFAP